MGRDRQSTTVTRRTFLTLLSAAAGTAAWPKGAIAATPKYRLKLSHHMPLTYIVETMSQKFATEVAARTKGEVEIKVFGAGQLGGLKDNAENVKLGMLDLAWADTSQLALFHARADIISLPFIFRDYAHYMKVIDGPVGKQLAKEILDKTNIRILAFWPAGFRVMASRTKPIRNAADMKGLKIRIPEMPLYVDTMKALGANATPMPFGEIYTGLQTGVIDATENPCDILLNAKMYEVAKYLSRTYHIFTDVGLLVSEKTFAALPPDVQKTFYAVAREIVWEWGAAESQKLINSSWDGMVKQGMQGIEPDRESFRAAVKPVYDAFAARTNTGDWIKAIQETK